MDRHTLAQARTENCCYRLGQKNQVTESVEGEVALDASFLAEIEFRLRAMAPVIMQEAKLAKTEPKDRLG